jgi:cell division protein FtsB
LFDSEKIGSYIPGLSLHRIVVVTSLFVVVYSGFTIAGNATRSYQLNAQTKQLQKGIAEEQAEYSQLTALRRYMQSDAFIESAAREEGLGFQGDTAIIVSAPQSTGSASKQSSQGAWWQRYYGR